MAVVVEFRGDFQIALKILARLDGCNAGFELGNQLGCAVLALGLSSYFIVLQL